MIMNINRQCCWLVGVYVLQILARTHTHTHVPVGSFSELIGCFNVLIIIWCSILLYYGKKNNLGIIVVIIIIISITLFKHSNSPSVIPTNKQVSA